MTQMEMSYQTILRLLVCTKSVRMCTRWERFLSRIERRQTSQMVIPQKIHQNQMAVIRLMARRLKMIVTQMIRTLTVQMLKTTRKAMILPMNRVDNK